MPFNSEGIFNRIFNWVEDKQRDIPIRADRMDQEMDSFALALNDISHGRVPFQDTVTLSQGSEKKPSISFINNPGSGLYCRSDGHIGILCNGDDIGSLSPTTNRETDITSLPAFSTLQSDLNDLRATLQSISQPSSLVIWGMRRTSDSLIVEKCTEPTVDVSKYDTFAIMPEHASWEIDQNGHLLIEI